MTDLSIHLAGLHLRNPLLPGSGPPGDSPRKLRELEAAGVGALVTKTISVEPATVPKPCMAFDGDLFFNIERWSNKPYSEWLGSILPALQSRQVSLVLSVGYTAEDIETLIPLFNPLVDAFEISTHYVSTAALDLLNTVRRAKQLTEKPLFVKLSVHGGDIVANAVVCEKGGADGIAAINSIGPAMSIDVDKRASRLGETLPYLWLSGPAIKPIALRAVYDISRAVAIPVIGCGGISNGRDVIEFMLAGARAVQLCTALCRHGSQHVAKVLAEITEWCAAQGVANIRDIVGTVIPHYCPTENS